MVNYSTIQIKRWKRLIESPRTNREDILCSIFPKRNTFKIEKERKNRRKVFRDAILLKHSGKSKKSVDKLVNLYEWENVLGKREFKCECCGKKIYFGMNDPKNAVHFDHKEKNPCNENPSVWLRRHGASRENIRKWESFDFGKLCKRCNFLLPTENRKEWIIMAFKYVFSFDPTLAIMKEKANGEISEKNKIFEIVKPT